MKKLFTIALLLVASSVAAQGYNISCKVDSVYEGRTVYLIDKNSSNSIDSCLVAEGKFVFNGTLDSDAVYDVVVNRAKGAVKTLLVAPSSNISVDFTVRPAAVTDNGGYNEALLSMIDAYVDAQLSHFDISEDIHLSIEPEIINSRQFMDKDYYGLNLNISF